MGEWLQHAGRDLAWGRPGDLWLVVAVPVAVRLAVQCATKWIERMEATGPARLRLAWLTAAMPGIAFLMLAPAMIHLFDFGMMSSPACVAHCYGLTFLMLAVAGTAMARVWWRSRTAAQLLNAAREPSLRLARFARELRIEARELQADAPICAVAGIRKPRVLVSRGTLERLSDEELRAALAHERAHVRRRETLLEGLAAFLNKCTIAPVPTAMNLYRRSREFVADQEAAGEVEPTTLARVLVTFARFEVRSSCAVQLSEAANLRDRVTLLLNGKAPSAFEKQARATAIALIASCVMLALLPASAHMVQRLLCSRSQLKICLYLLTMLAVRRLTL